MKNIKFITISIISILLFTVILPSTISTSKATLINSDNDGLNNLSEMKINLLMKIGRIPSLSVCFIKNDSIIFYKGLGYANRAEKKIPNKDTVYKVASITKSVTATAMMQIIENESYGVDIDDDINDYLNFSVRNPNHPDIPITFRMLMAHQASFYPNSELAQMGTKYMGDLLRSTFPVFNKYDYPYPYIKEYLKSSDRWLDIEPGKEAYYGNTAYVLLEHLIERITDKSYEDYCQENIFVPLKMKNTSFETNELGENTATYYVSLMLLPFPYYRSTITGAAGLTTSIEDLSHYLIAHMNNGTYDGVRILKNETVELMHSKQFPDSIGQILGYYFGLGWEIYPEDWIWNGMVLQGHAGSTIGGGGEMLWNESSDLGIIAFMNRKMSRLSTLLIWCYDQIITELLKNIEI